MAARCFNRFNNSFNGNDGNAYTDNNNNFSTAHNPTALATVFSAPDQANDDAWYPDSGSTNHVTNDLNNLNLACEYRGNNRVQIGNGTGLPISNIGCSYLIPTHSSRHTRLILKNLLHVPAIKKNLISVAQFSFDNNVFFEFHPLSSCVKDLETRQVLLRGTLEHGLYRFHLDPKDNRFRVSTSTSTTTTQPNPIPCVHLVHRPSKPVVFPFNQSVSDTKTTESQILAFNQSVSHNKNDVIFLA